MTLPRIYTAAEVAEVLGCDTSTVYRMLDDGRIAYFTVGVGTRRRGCVRVTEDALRAYMGVAQ